ncbi:facilitated trehalose transporter Tret1 [Eurytemora carolleeae]|uniref:facilitated trehalose transporter Tret1 n=1 Tax=Eurytemora carolleeae TaxID=1294199 RepID=UPI000C763ACF|nr:facilitated trehalose transporter Tret1 [Eurytemora carolleeae]|eukprot:XP_023320285.1 facilitated trehalose transporter Tret1-like [Eurytemora affinis]
MESIQYLQTTAKNTGLYVTTSVLCIHNFLLGFCFVYAGVTMPYHQTGSFGYILMTEDQITWYISLNVLMILVGALVSSPLSEWLGRKRGLILAHVLHIGSCIIMLFGYSYSILLVGWLINGFSAGVGVILPYTLASEISTIKLRGVLANLNNLCQNYGMLLLYGMNMIIPPQYLLFHGITLSLLFLLCSPFIVYSPHWLVRHGKVDEAEKMLRVLRGPDYVGIKHELKEVLAVTDENSNNKSCMKRWTSRQFLIPLGIIMTMFGSIGLCGIDAPINLYGPSMFAEFGFTIPFQILMLFIPTGSAVGYTASVFIAKKLKKKNQFILAASIMAFSAGLISLSYYLKDLSQAESFYKLCSQILFSIGVFGLMSGYGAGYGSVTYTIPGELLAPEDKSIGGASAESTRMIVTAIVLKVYPDILDVIGTPIMFMGHALAIILAGLFVFKFLPDTDDKSISEIQALFKKKDKELV